AAGRSADHLQLVDRIIRGRSIESHVSTSCFSTSCFSKDRAKGALGQRQLEGVLARWPRAFEQLCGDGSRTARQFGLRRLDTPRLVRDAAERDAPAAVTLHDGSH